MDDETALPEFERYLRRRRPLRVANNASVLASALAISRAFTSVSCVDIGLSKQQDEPRV